MNNPVFNIAISQSERVTLLSLLKNTVKTFFNSSKGPFIQSDIVKGIISDLESVIDKLESTFGKID